MPPYSPWRTRQRSHPSDTMAESEPATEPRHTEAAGDGKETRFYDFYPLDVPDLPFSRYEHSGLTERDLMVHNIMELYMNPFKAILDGRRYTSCTDDTCNKDTERYHKVLHDMGLLDACLFTLQDFKKEDDFLEFPVSFKGPSSLCPPAIEWIVDFAMRHYLETDDSAMRAWIADTGCLAVPRAPKQSRANSFDWDSLVWSRFCEVEIAQLSKDRSLIEAQADSRLYGGGAFAPAIRRGLDQFDIGIHGASRTPAFQLRDLDSYPRSWDSAPLWPEAGRWTRYMLIPQHKDRHFLRSHLCWPTHPIKDFTIHPGRGRNRDGHWSTGRNHPSSTADGRYGRGRRRCTSLPPEGSFACATLPASREQRVQGDLALIFPRMSVLDLDRRSRRRSLSRTRIEELFDWDVNPRGQRPSPTRCHNCRSSWHQCTECSSPCGYCGTISREYHNYLRRQLGKVTTKDFFDVNPHAAPECPVSPKNRCKCIAFPTFHTAKDCRITCHRACGNPAVPGSLRHRNAMLCKSRCCMCGIRGHSGKECTLKKCRCGGHHLGQDCCWNPTCRVKGCDRYLCGVHCRDCGSAEGKPFKDRKCWRCHGADGPFEWTKQRPRRAKKNSEQPAPDGAGEEATETSPEVEAAGDQKITVLSSLAEQEIITVAPKHTIFNNPGWSFSGVANGESSRN